MFSLSVDVIYNFESLVVPEVLGCLWKICISIALAVRILATVRYSANIRIYSIKLCI